MPPIRRPDGLGGATRSRLPPILAAVLWLAAVPTRMMDCAALSQGFVYGAVYAEDGGFIESTSQDRARLKLTPIPPGNWRIGAATGVRSGAR